MYFVSAWSGCVDRIMDHLCTDSVVEIVLFGWPGSSPVTAGCRQKSRQSKSAVYRYSCVHSGVLHVYVQENRLLKLAVSLHTHGVEITMCPVYTL